MPAALDSRSPLQICGDKLRGNTPCAGDAPMRLKVCGVRLSPPWLVIASDHRERGNLTVFRVDYAPQLL